MAASSALFLPLETPTPSMAVPLLHMMAFTSAKSTLTRPGMVMMSEMPCTPCARSSQAEIEEIRHWREYSSAQGTRPRNSSPRLLPVKKYPKP